MPLPRISKLKLEDVEVDADRTALLRFRPEAPVRFKAGQHALWRIPGGGVRPFTIASAPEEELVGLATVLHSNSRLKRALAALEPGDAVRLAGPLSKFTLEGTAGPIVMLAQGIGITPFRSMLRHTAIAGEQADARLVHVGDQHAFRNETEQLAARAVYPGSRDEFGDALSRAVEATPDAEFLISGSPSFVSGTRRSLIALGVASSAVRADRFWGSQPLRTTGPEPLAA